MKLSICIPVYNNIEYTKQVLENIYAYNTMNKDDYEIVIFDDGSTNKEESRELLRSMCIDDGGFKYLQHIYEENKGVTEAWNTLAYMARGDYICIINNDILFPPMFGRWEAIFESLEDKEVMISCPLFSTGEEVNFNNLTSNENRCNINGHCFVFRQEDRERLFPIDKRLKIRYNDDYLYHTVIDEYKKKIARVPVPVYHFEEKTTRNTEVHIKGKDDMQTWKTICEEKGRKDFRFS